jgi:hypothetical protein
MVAVREGRGGGVAVRCGAVLSKDEVIYRD